MEIHNLTTLQYSEDRRGPWRLYIYETASDFNADPRHSGGVWFARARLSDTEEIPMLAAKVRALKAIAEGREVRICDGGDFLVFHAKGGKVLYGENFFKEIE